MELATLQNKAGVFVAPDPDSAAKALDGQKPNDNLVVKVPDPTGKGAYPIVSLTYALLYGNYPAPKGSTLKDLFTWTQKEGGAAAKELGFIPLPADLQKEVIAKLDTIQEK